MNPGEKMIWTWVNSVNHETISGGKIMWGQNGLGAKWFGGTMV